MKDNNPKRQRMKPNTQTGLFIDIEGLDGSGASTQIDLLKKSLKSSKIEVYTTKEPTDNLIGGLARGALTGIYSLPAETLQLLFVADRYHHLERQIVPILANHSILITDRLCWSTIAFGSLNLSRTWLLNLHRYCVTPDLTIFLKVSPKVCIQRMEEDRFDFELFEEEKKLKRVWKTYEWLAKKFPKEIIIVDGERSAQQIHREILNLVERNSKFRKLEKR